MLKGRVLCNIQKQNLKLFIIRWHNNPYIFLSNLLFIILINQIKAVWLNTIIMLCLMKYSHKVQITYTHIHMRNHRIIILWACMKLGIQIPNIRYIKWINNSNTHIHSNIISNNNNNNNNNTYNNISHNNRTLILQKLWIYSVVGMNYNNSKVTIHKSLVYWATSMDWQPKRRLIRLIISWTLTNL